MPVVALGALTAMADPTDPMVACATNTVEGRIDSHDGTLIAYSLLFPRGASAEHPVPVVVQTHGGTDRRARSTQDDQVVKPWLDEGYAVLTYDSRGHGGSGGEFDFHSQALGVKDVRELIWQVAVPCERILDDGRGDKRIGLFGASNAAQGAIMVAAAEPTVDAVATMSAMYDVPTVLRQNGVVRDTMTAFLLGGMAPGLVNAPPGTTHTEDLDPGLLADDWMESPAETTRVLERTGAYPPAIVKSFADLAVTGDLASDTMSWWDARSPRHFIAGGRVGKERIPGIQAPTLVVSTVFDRGPSPWQQIQVYETLRKRDVTTQLVLACFGSHNLRSTAQNRPCQPPAPYLGTDGKPGPVKFFGEVARRWFARHLKGDAAIETGPPIVYQLGTDTWGALDRLKNPRGNASVIVAQGSTGELLQAGDVSTRHLAGGAEGCVVQHASADAHLTPLPAQARCQDLPTAASVAFHHHKGGALASGTTVVGTAVADLTIDARPRCDRDLIVGACSSSIVLRVVAVTPEGSRTVIGDQETALRVPPGTSTHRIELEPVVWHWKAGHSLELELSTASYEYAMSRYPGTLDVDVDVRLPIVEHAPLTPAWWHWDRLAPEVRAQPRG